MVVLSLIGYGVCGLATEEKAVQEEDFVLVTSFYPMYILGQNLTRGIDGVFVSNLTENQTGCLHDYQLTAKDMKLLSRADAFLVNGAGMELFLEKVLSQAEELPIIEAAHGISLLEGVEHNHEHNHAHEEETVEHEEEHLGNGHVWMDVDRYRLQVRTVLEELSELLPEYAGQLEEAATAYDARLRVLSAETAVLKEETTGQHAVVFHEAFAYLAESLGIEVIAMVSLDEETVPSAGEIADLIEEIRYHGAVFVFIEEAYASYADKIEAETDAVVVYLDPLTTGDGETDSYLTGMWQNLSAVREALEK